MDVNITCLCCGAVKQLHVDPASYQHWQAGMHIQDAMPELTPGERELLISNVCEDCYDKLFKEED